MSLNNTDKKKSVNDIYNIIRGSLPPIIKLKESSNSNAKKQVHKPISNGNHAENNKNGGSVQELESMLSRNNGQNKNNEQYEREFEVEESGEVEFNNLNNDNEISSSMEVQYNRDDENVKEFDNTENNENSGNIENNENNEQSDRESDDSDSDSDSDSQSSSDSDSEHDMFYEKKNKNTPASLADQKIQEYQATANKKEKKTQSCNKLETFAIVTPSKLSFRYAKPDGDAPWFVMKDIYPVTNIYGAATNKFKNDKKYMTLEGKRAVLLPLDGLIRLLLHAKKATNTKEILRALFKEFPQSKIIASSISKEQNTKRKGKSVITNKPKKNNKEESESDREFTGHIETMMAEDIGNRPENQNEKIQQRENTENSNNKSNDGLKLLHVLLNDSWEMCKTQDKKDSLKKSMSKVLLEFMAE